MTYYRVPRTLDNVPNKKIGILVGNELFTYKELIKYNLLDRINELEQVDVSKKSIYWFFGARFASKSN